MTTKLVTMTFIWPNLWRVRNDNKIGHCGIHKSENMMKYKHLQNWSMWHVYVWIYNELQTTAKLVTVTFICPNLWRVTNDFEISHGDFTKRSQSINIFRMINIKCTGNFSQVLWDQIITYQNFHLKLLNLCDKPFFYVVYV